MNFSAKIFKVTVTVLFIPVFVMTVVLSGSLRVTGATSEDAAATFKAKCAACHAGDGSGSTPAGKAMKVRDLRSAEVQGQTDAQLFDIVAKGKGKMPGYEKSLGADACKALVSHIRTFKQ